MKKRRVLWPWGSSDRPAPESQKQPNWGPGGSSQQLRMVAWGAGGSQGKTLGKGLVQLCLLPFLLE